MRILLTGGNGQIGRSLKRRQPDHWETIAADSRTLDITQADSIENMVQNFEPDVIINTAGYTDLARAKQDASAAFAINATGTQNLAQAAAQHGIRFISLSSDDVFDGRQHMPYRETDCPNPRNVYGQTKLAGELLALAANPNSLIIRSSWVFSEFGDNIVGRIAAGKYQPSETEKICCPTYAGDLAQLIVSLVQRETPPRGILHYCGDCAVSSAEFAQTVRRLLALNNAVPTAEAATHAPYAVLSCDKIRTLGYTPSDWRTALKQVVQNIQAT